MMSSHQISAMAMQQQAMFGNAANYAQQISPPGSMFGGYGPGAPPGPPQASGMNTSWGGGPQQGGLMQMAAQMPYQMPGQYMSQGFSEQLTGAGLGTMAGMGTGMANIAAGVTGVAGLATLGFGAAGAVGGMATGAGAVAGYGAGTAALSALPLGGAVMAAGGMTAMGAAGAMAVGAYVGEQAYEGFRERQDVNRVMRQRFGGKMGVGGGRGGVGFNNQEMGQMSSMMRDMSENDMFTGFDELTRTLDKTAQMGLFRGSQGIDEFKKKFKKTVDTLKDVAKVMHTSLDEAAGLMEGQRNQGFFSGQDISSSLMRTRMLAGASGMTTQEMQQIGQQGTMMGRSMGMLGRTGSNAMKEMASNTRLAMEMGVLSDEDVAEATGGLTGAAGAQALAARQMQSNGRFMKRGAGRAMLAGMWDQDGGVDKGMLDKVMAGDVSFAQVLSSGRKNIRETGGRRSSFFLDQDRIAGQAMAEGGQSMMIGMLGQHIAGKKGLEMEDPRVKRWLMRQTGRSREEIDIDIKQFRKMPEILQEKKVRMRQQIEMEGRSQAREVGGFQGFRRRVNQSWERNVSGRIKRAGDEALDSVNEAVEDLLGEMEGRIDLRMSEAGKAAAIELRSTGKGGLFGRSSEQSAQLLQKISREYAPGDAPMFSLANAGRNLGMRGQGLERSLRTMGAYKYGGLGAKTSRKAKIAHLTAMQSEWSNAQAGVDMTNEQRTALESSIQQAVTSGGDAAGSVGLMTTATGAVDAHIQRVNFLEQESPEFRQMTAGKSFMEKMAIMEAGSGKLEGSDYDIGAFGGGASSGKYSKLAYDREAMAAYQKKTTNAAQDFFTAGAKKRGDIVLKTSGYDTEWRGKFGGGLEGVRKLMSGNSKFAGQLEALTSGSASQKKAARAELLTLGGGGGGGVMSGEEASKLSVSTKRAMKAIAKSSEEDGEGTAEVLRDMAETEAANQEGLAIVPRAKQAEELQDYLRSKASGLKDIEAKVAANSFQAIVDKRARGDNPEEDEDRWLMKYAHTDVGQDVLGVLDADTEGRGVYQAAAIRGVRDWVRRVGEGNFEKGSRLISGGKGQEGARIKALMKASLGTMTKEGLSALGKTPREQNAWLRKIRLKQVDTADLMKHMQEQGGIDLAKGVTTASLTKHLEGNLADIQDTDGFTGQDLLRKGVDLAQNRSQRYRQDGAPDEDQDLPSLAKKQVMHLKTMVKLTTMLMNKKHDFKITINKKGEIIQPDGDE